MEWLMIVLMAVCVLLAAGCAFLLFSMREQQLRLEHLMEKNQSLASSAQNLGLQQTTARLDQLSGHLESLAFSSGQSKVIMDQLEGQMQAMSQVMNNTKKRGSWGEYQLEYLVRTYLGDSCDIYQTQYHLENGRIADGVFHLPGTKRVLCIDSKFPMENYTRLCEEQEDSAYYEREFRANVKKHINDVASKYITGQTADQALLFIPSEAVYYFIVSECRDLMDYAFERRVMLVSPTSLSSIVYALLSSSRDFYQAGNLELMRKRIKTLQDNVVRLQERAVKAEKSAARLQDDLHDLQVSASRTASGILAVLDGKDGESL